MNAPYVDELASRDGRNIRRVFIAIGWLVLALILVSAITGAYG